VRVVENLSGRETKSPARSATRDANASVGKPVGITS
jgi:hypothetical protein